ncbi:MAG TPA: hypothetical protein VGO00_27820 [Kofleriaceae bacterium]|nr:hypothetical protein [Kofleriaceae bacterium]
MALLRHIALVIGVASCATPTDDVVRRYLADDDFRRAELVASLVAPTNRYSQRRLDNYEAWERLPEWNPRVRRGAELRALVISDAAQAGDRDALIALGETAFFAYPAQQLPPAAAPADGYGLRGLVEVEMADGTMRLAYTCATCHAAVRDGQIVPGLANAELDLGRWLADSLHLADGPMRAWGPGRADVSTRSGTEPVRIPDLRATRYQTHLQVNATVEQRNLASLALRIETLLVAGHGEILRPPREIAMGLALYLWTLAPSPRAIASDAERAGRDVFDAECSRCHTPPSFAGRPVAIDEIGIDAVGQSAERGTGLWRVPSLIGVTARAPLFHDGAAATLDAVLDPARRGAAHRFGLDLDAVARADLLAYLRTL